MDHDVTGQPPRGGPSVADGDRDAADAPETPLREIIDASPVAISVATRAGENLLCNRKFAEMLGFLNQAEFRRVDAHALYVDPDQRRRMKDELYRIGYTPETEVQFKHRDGGVVTGLLCSKLVLFEGRVAHISWVWDITERQRAEAALRAEKTRAEEALAALVEAQAALVERSDALTKLNDTLAHEIAERRQAQEELERLATIDPLTQIANRRHFLALAERELARMRRDLTTAAVLMLDIDHFKAVNDTHGHAVGDQVLQAVAAGCARMLRDVDLFGRLGGEEFAVVLPDTDLDAATVAAERLRATVAGLALEIAHGAAPIAVTISLGVAAFGAHHAGVEGALSRADAALYAAKRAGRNRTVIDGRG
jgi:diguanylate cyclase (GGDEF)-like protein/PAS domain S-box-containing protein